MCVCSIECDLYRECIVVSASVAGQLMWSLLQLGAAAAREVGELSPKELEDALGYVSRSDTALIFYLFLRHVCAMNVL